MTNYLIYDVDDSNYDKWVGTVEQIERYLLEQYDNDNFPSYDKSKSWRENLGLYGLSYRRVH